MRIILFVLILCVSTASAQIPPYCKQVNDIAFMERLGHSRLLDTTGVTGVSNNFDIKYYRCEWEVDPAVRYINGKVTIYFVITSATNAIALDLMNNLTTDSVKQRNTLLTKQHTNNVLQV